MTKTEMIAEAIYQLNAAKKSGIKDIVPTTEFIYTLFNNGTGLINRAGELTVQFELQGRIFSVIVR